MACWMVVSKAKAPGSSLGFAGCCVTGLPWAYLYGLGGG